MSTAISTSSTTWCTERAARAALIHSHFDRSAAHALFATSTAADAWAEACDRNPNTVGPSRIDTLVSEAEQLQARLIIPGDPEWPRRLDVLGDKAPLGLWAIGPGDLGEYSRNSLTIIGSGGSAISHDTRDEHRIWGYSLAGDQVFMRVSRDAIEREPQMTIVSALTWGTNAKVLEGALERDGRALAVQACGADQTAPSDCPPLRERLASEHLIISDQPLGHQATDTDLDNRAQLLGALTTGVLVAEASHYSHALTTASWAHTLGHLVMVMADKATALTTAGLEMVQDNRATLVLSPFDVQSHMFDHLT